VLHRVSCHGLCVRRSPRFFNRACSLALAALLATSCGSGDDDQRSGSDEPSASTTTGAPATTASPTTTVAPTTTTTTEAPKAELELVETGPYAVGVTTIRVDDGERGRPLTVDVWFPLAEGIVGSPRQYTLIPGVYYESPFAIAAEVESVATDGPFPLVVYSHGSNGLRYIHSNYTEMIASHGYVVAAADHTGNTSVDLLAGTSDDVDVIAFNRPTDVSVVIDEMLDVDSDVAGGIAAIIDPDRVAVTGHSFGGFTSYATISGYENTNGVYEADDRVDAIITLAPATNPALLSDERLAAVDVPTLVIVGTDDKTTPVDPNVTRPWELTTSEIAYRVELLAAEHQTFTDVCDYVDFLPTLAVVPQIITDTINNFATAGCQPGDMPVERAQPLTNTFAIAFLEEVFRDGAPIDPATTVIPDDVTYLVR
jgi:predicted dienelactone hydrolase